MLNQSHATTTPDGIASLLGTSSTPESMVDQSTAAAKKRKKKKNKKPQTTATPRTTENHPRVENLTTAKAAAEAAAVAAAEAAEAAEEAAVAAEEAAEAAGRAAEAAARAAEAAARAAEAAARAAARAVKAARVANTAAKAAAEAVEAVEAARAAKAAVGAVEAVKAAEESEAEESDTRAGEYLEYEESEENLAKTTFLYVPVEGDIQVLPRSFATTEEILQWPNTECHTLSNLKLVHERYILTGFIRSFDFKGPINKRYSKIYGDGTAEIRGPAMIVNENGLRTLSLTEKDIPRIFR